MREVGYRVGCGFDLQKAVGELRALLDHAYAERADEIARVWPYALYAHQQKYAESEEKCPPFTCNDCDVVRCNRAV